MLVAGVVKSIPGLTDLAKFFAQWAERMQRQRTEAVAAKRHDEKNKRVDDAIAAALAGQLPNGAIEQRGPTDRPSGVQQGSTSSPGMGQTSTPNDQRP